MGRKIGYGTVLVLVALASFAIVLDRLTGSERQNVDYSTPPTTYATTSLPPHPASPARTPALR